MTNQVQNSCTGIFSINGPIASRGDQSYNASSLCIVMRPGALGAEFCSRMGARFDQGTTGGMRLQISATLRLVHCAIPSAPLRTRYAIPGSMCTLVRRTLKAAIENYGCKNSAVNDSVKEILELSRLFNFIIDMHYIPSHDNHADSPSRERSDLDCTLSEKAWKLVESIFGPHTFNLMASDRQLPE